MLSFNTRTRTITCTHTHTHTHTLSDTHEYCTLTPDCIFNHSSILWPNHLFYYSVSLGSFLLLCVQLDAHYSMPASSVASSLGSRSAENHFFFISRFEFQYQQNKVLLCIPIFKGYVLYDICLKNLYMLITIINNRQFAYGHP